MSVRIEDHRGEWDKFVRGMRDLARGPFDVVTGIQQGVTNADGLDVATYATVNEFGAVIRRSAGENGPTRPTVIPSRPFMRMYFDKNEQKIGVFAENALLRAMRGQTTLQQSFTAIGLYTQAGLRAQIRRSGDFVPNAPATVRMKGSDKPLIDHAILLNNISFAVR